MILYVPNKLQIEIPDEIKYVLPDADYMNAIFWSRSECIEKSLISWALSDLMKGGLFVDIGAHIGTWSLQFGAKHKVVAFEANPKTFGALKRGIAVNGFDIEAHHMALGSPELHKKDVTLKTISPDGGGSSICPELPSYHKVLAEWTVPCRTLDSFDLDDIGLIKIDVEGAELEVLQGAVETLRRNNNPKFLFEAWNYDWYAQKRDELFSYINDELGYEIYPIKGYSEMWLASFGD